MLKTLAFIILFAIILPVAGHGEASQSGSNQQHPEKGPPPPSLRCEINQDGTSIQCYRAESVTKGYFSRLFTAENTPNIALFFVGLAGVIAAVGTLRFINQQVIEMRRQRIVMRQTLSHMETQAEVLDRSVSAGEKSAHAAEVSAATAMGVAVPRLMLHELNFGPMGAASFEAKLQYPNIRIALKNYGQTAAFLKAYSVVLTCDDLPDNFSFGHPVYKAVYLDTQDVVMPGEIYLLEQGLVRPRDFVSTNNIEAIINRTKKMTIHGYVCYGDIFGSPDWYMRFGRQLVDWSDDGSKTTFRDH